MQSVKKMKAKTKLKQCVTLNVNIISKEGHCLFVSVQYFPTHWINYGKKMHKGFNEFEILQQMTYE